MIVVPFIIETYMVAAICKDNRFLLIMDKCNQNFNTAILM